MRDDLLRRGGGRARHSALAGRVLRPASGNQHGHQYDGQAPTKEAVHGPWTHAFARRFRTRSTRSDTAHAAGSSPARSTLYRHVGAVPPLALEGSRAFGSDHVPVEIDQAVLGIPWQRTYVLPVRGFGIDLLV